MSDITNYVMSNRKYVVVLFIIIIAAELLIFIGQPVPTINKGENILPDSEWKLKVLYSQYNESEKYFIDHQLHKNINTKFAIILFATILTGAIVIFSIPTTTITKQEQEDEKDD